MTVRIPVPDFDPAHVRSLAKQIVDEPQFRQPPKSWYTAALDWVGRQLDHLVGHILNGGPAGTIGWIIAVLAVAAALFFVTRFARRIRVDPAIAVTHPDYVRKTAAEWAADAAEHERNGRWRDALRCRYRSLVAALAERGIVEEVPGRTTGEYQALVDRNLPGAVDDFGDATELFESVWYGNHDGGPGEPERLEAIGRRVLAEAGKR